MRMSPWATVRFPFLDFSLEMGVHTPAAGLWDHREGRGGLSRPLDALKWPPSCSQGTRNNAGSSVALHFKSAGVREAGAGGPASPHLRRGHRRAHSPAWLWQLSSSRLPVLFLL